MIRKVKTHTYVYKDYFWWGGVDYVGNLDVSNWWTLVNDKSMSFKLGILTESADTSWLKLFCLGSELLREKVMWVTLDVILQFYLKYSETSERTSKVPIVSSEGLTIYYDKV